MEPTELSLAPTQFVIEKSTNSSSSESESNGSRKRKLFTSDNLLKSTTGPPVQTSVDLHVNDPLPLDWEQCLDLESGRMYYVNKKTLRKSWNWPKVQKVDLELNISSAIPNCTSPEQSDQDYYSNKLQLASSSSNMVALACLNCHLLVILSKSSPSCPNCKYVHSLPILQTSQPKISQPKSLNTLRLLN